MLLCITYRHISVVSADNLLHLKIICSANNQYLQIHKKTLSVVLHLQVRLVVDLGHRLAALFADPTRLNLPFPGANCIKIGLPGKIDSRRLFPREKDFQRPFLLVRIRFPGRPIFIQLVPVKLSHLGVLPLPHTALVVRFNVLHRYFLLAGGAFHQRINRVTLSHHVTDDVLGQGFQFFYLLSGLLIK